ncbi:MAG: NAD-dependent epimerase/dehydratase family protein [Bacillaceae bacterium]|nr:NAD-dependent epimerase/dehydratase family protein [Bacillaceae bacterium]
MKKALVLGGTQFFGKRLVHLLLEKGVEVTIATRGNKQDPFENQVERLKIDREKTASLKKALDGRKWDVVYDQSCFSPIEMKDTLKVLGENANKYIFTSTMAVYDYGTDRVEEDFRPETYSFREQPRANYKGIEGYQEAKRASEAVLFQQSSHPAVAVRFPIVIGEDDYTNRLKFHVERIRDGKPISILHPEARYSFISSKEAAEFLYWAGTNDVTGPINPAARGHISMQELINQIEQYTEKKAHIQAEANPGCLSPYDMGGSWTVNTEKAESLGYRFESLNKLLHNLICYYL